MKNNKYLYTKITCCFGLIFITIIGCERNLSEEAVFASLANTAEIFTDAPVGMGSNFYFPYGPDDTNPVGSKLTAWSVDNNESYEGSASMRFDVPNSNDPEGNFAGAIFLIDGTGRDLTGYNALTFWAKASQGATIAEMGFGETKFATKLINFNLSTQWTKYIIPIPDASKLTEERGMLFYSAGSINDMGYTFWLDEVKFEKLGTIAQPRPQMLSGEDVVEQTFTSSTIQITGLTQTFNLGSGVNQTVAAAPSYFTFSSSNVEVAQVSELGIVSVLGTGTAEITAILNGVLASGSLTVTSTGAIENSPIPTQLAADVKSVFSDTYINAVESNFDPRFGGSTTQASLIASNSNSYQAYTDNNFTGIIFESNLDATDLTTFHIDVYTQDASSSTVSFQIRDIGANGVIDSDNDGNPIEDDKDLRFDASGLQVGQWVSFDIPLTGNIATQKDNLGAIILVGGTSFILDNIYFYK